MPNVQPASGGHQLTLTDRKLLSVSGVSEVRSFDECGVSLMTEQGIMEIEGEELHISRLDLQAGLCEISGSVSGIFYRRTATRGGLFRRKRED